MSKKGLSADEKRTKMLEIFHETGDVFQLKDLEKIAPKQKGIVQQSVKGVLLELVNDGLVDSQKIGTSLYYWAFPSKAINDLRKQIQEQEAANEAADQRIKQLEESLQKASANLENIDAITKEQNEVTLLKVKKAELEKELLAFGDDPEAIATKEAEIKKYLEAANRWTDNIFYIKSWCKRKFGKEDNELNKGFGIPEDLDYLEE